MKKQNGFSQIFVMMVMLILAIALPVTANLVKKVQDNRSSAATTKSASGTCFTKGGNCVTSYTGMSSGITCSGSTGGTNGGTTNTSYSCLASDGSSSGEVCCVPNASNSTSGSAGTGSGAEACVAKGGLCQTIKNTDGSFSMPSVGTNNCIVHGVTGSIEANLCSGQYNSSFRCCVPGSAPAPAAPAPAAPVVTGCGTPRNQCFGNDLKHCNGTDWSLVTACPAGCDGGNNTCKDECTLGQAATCPSATTKQFCNKDADGGIRLKTETCANGCTNGVCNTCTAGARQCSGSTLQICTSGKWGSDPLGSSICVGDVAFNCDASPALNTATCQYGCSSANPGHCNGAPVCTAETKQCSGGNAQICKTDSTGWTSTACGTLGCNETTKVCNVCTPGTQECSTTTNKYLTCSASGTWSTATTDCTSGKVCTNGDTGTTVCHDPAYVAPQLNVFFAISGVKKVNSCFGDLNFKISVTKDGSSVITTREVTATAVDNKFNTNLGDQVFKISDFALTSDYALTDKIKITIGSNRKTLATVYGKDNQVAGFPALNTSNILVSDLVGKTLNLYDYPVLNGDIGSEGSLGTQDNIVNGFDFALMKTQWHTTCSEGQNLESDLDGDCYVGSSDLQIQKNAMGEQLAQKTD